MVRYMPADSEWSNLLQLREAVLSVVSTPFEFVADVLMRSSAKADEKVLRVLLEWPLLHPSWVPVLMRAYANGELRVDADGDVWVRGRLIMSTELADKAR